MWKVWYWIVIVVLFSKAVLAHHPFNISIPQRSLSLVSIVGTVSTASGAPVENIFLEWSNEIGGSAVSCSDFKGDFVFSSVTGGDMSIRFSYNINRCGPRNVLLPGDFSFSTNFATQVSISALSIVLPESQCKNVTVQNDQGVPGAGFWVIPGAVGQDSSYSICAELSSPEYTFSGACGLEGWAAVQTDRTGYANICFFPNTNNPAFEIILTAKMASWWNLDLSGVLSKSAPFKIAQGSESFVLIVIPRTISLFGRVLTQDNMPVPGMVVHWNNPIGGFEYAETGSNGDFGWSALNSGNMSLTFDNTYAGKQAGIPGCLHISTSFFAVNNLNSFVAKIASVIIVDVFVQDSTGSPMPGLQVWPMPGGNGSTLEICPPNLSTNKNASGYGLSCISQYIGGQSSGCRSSTFVTDATGHAQVPFLKLPNFTASIQAIDSSSRFAISPIFFLDEETNTTITLPPFISIGGYVVSETGERVRIGGIAVRIGPQLTYTNSDGYYFTEHAVPGNIDCAIGDVHGGIANGLLPPGWIFYFHISQLLSSNSLNITIPPIVTRDIVVIDQLNNTVPGAKVYVYNKNYQWYISLCANVPIVPGDEGSKGCGQMYVGDGPAAITDSKGFAKYSFFSTTSSQNGKVLIGCEDPLNTARVAAAFLTLSSNASLQLILQSPPSSPKALHAEISPQPAQNTSTNPTAVSLSWEKPTTDGGFPLTNYTVVADPLNSNTSDNNFETKRRLAGSAAISVSVPPSHTSALLNNLQAGVNYTVTVFASNQLGTSKGVSTKITVPILLAGQTTTIISTIKSTHAPSHPKTMIPNASIEVQPLFGQQTNNYTKAGTKNPRNRSIFLNTTTPTKSVPQAKAISRSPTIPQTVHKTLYKHTLQPVYTQLPEARSIIPTAKTSFSTQPPGVQPPFWQQTNNYTKAGTKNPRNRSIFLNTTIPTKKSAPQAKATSLSPTFPQTVHKTLYKHTLQPAYTQLPEATSFIPTAKTSFSTQPPPLTPTRNPWESQETKVPSSTFRSIQTLQPTLPPSSFRCKPLYPGCTCEDNHLSCPGLFHANASESVSLSAVVTISREGWTEGALSVVQSAFAAAVGVPPSAVNTTVIDYFSDTSGSIRSRNMQASNANAIYVLCVVQGLVDPSMILLVQTSISVLRTSTLFAQIMTAAGLQVFEITPQQLSGYATTKIATKKATMRVNIATKKATVRVAQLNEQGKVVPVPSNARGVCVYHPSVHFPVMIAGFVFMIAFQP